jgi:cytochrome c oxidase assembly protein subunit 15
MENSNATSVPRMIRILAIVMCCATFPLIFVGGLVTTMQAGMAVPDWPNTYGYNLFLYPLSTWIAGPWNIFVEHGHRLLGAGVGFFSLVTCALSFVTPREKQPRWLRSFSIAVLVAFISQGILGGMRVRLDSRQFALIHGCTGPIVFLLTLIFAECCSKKWLMHSCEVNPASAKLRSWSLMTTASAYIQLVIGAHLRHGIGWLSSSAFQIVTLFHLIFASLIVIESIALFFIARSVQAGNRFTNLTWVLALFIVAQVILGVCTWVLNYGWPWGYEKLQAMLPAGWAPTQITANGFSQTLVTTAHVAVGSLILATSGLFTFRSFTLFKRTKVVQAGSSTNGQLNRSAVAPVLNVRGDA